MRFKLATWNIHSCIGRDGLHSPDRIARVLRDIDADLMVLQEVESLPGHELDVLTFLAEQTGSRAIPGMTMTRRHAHYGNAVLTRFPTLEVRHHDLSVPHSEPRGAIDVDLDLNGRRVQLVATHLGLRPDERRWQARQLLPLFKVVNRDLVLLAGDLNEWFLWGRPLRMLHQMFPDTPHRRSFPAHFPVFSLDRVWVHPRAALVRLAAYRGELARVASDHLPLVATIEMP